MKFERVDIFKLGGLIVMLVILVGLVWLLQQELTTPTFESESQAATQAAAQEIVQGQAATQAAEQRSPEPAGALPAVPDSIVVLQVNAEKGIIFSPEGEELYVLSTDRTIWIPVVPQELADQLGDRIPQIDPLGNWVIVSTDGRERYTWDSETGTWLPVGGEVAVQPSEPAEEAGETESGEGESAQALPTREPTRETQAGGEATSAQPHSSPAATQTPASGQAAASRPGESADAGFDMSGVLAVPTPTPGLPRSYTLRSGEFAYCIARRFDINPYQLLSYNGLPTGAVLRGGTVLRIPPDPDPFPGRRALMAHPEVYTVQQGDTVHTVACKYGDVDPWAIAYANQLAEPYVLVPGMMIYIP